MILEQHYLGCLSQASYLIADSEAGLAAVVDPRRDVEVYLKQAAECGVEIRDVFLTHFHADFVSGHLELRERTGATIHIGAKAKADYAFRALSEGDEVTLGRVRLRILETPGHTPESISILVHDGESEDPHAVLTGDTLFIGDVGRPDLMSSQGTTAEALAAMLFDSTRKKLLTLPDATLVYPGHGAGSMCGKNLSTDTVSTIGDQRRFNYALQDMPREEFIAMITANQPKAPAYFGHDAQFNRQERETLESALERLVPLSMSDLVQALERGAVALDVRGAEDFAAGHLGGAVNIGLEGRFASWAGTVIDRETEVVLLAPVGLERESAVRLGRIGYDRVIGYLEGGPDAVPEDRLRVTSRVDPADLWAALQEADGPLVLDVRQPGERDNEALAGSLHIPLGDLPERVEELPRDRPLAVHCLSGYRSMVAASLLERAGLGDLVDLRGGLEAWKAAELPTIAGEGVACS